MKVTHLANGTGDCSSGPSVQSCPGSLFGNVAHNENCNVWYLGSINRSLAKAGYYPMPLPKGTKCSVQEVRTSLKSVCDGILNDPNGNISCSPVIDLRSSLAGVGCQVDLTETQRNHLQQQAAKSSFPIMESPAQSFLIPASFGPPIGTSRGIFDTGSMRLGKVK